MKNVNQDIIFLLQFLFEKEYDNRIPTANKKMMIKPSTKGEGYEDHEGNSDSSNLLVPCRVRRRRGRENPYRADRATGHLRMSLNLQPWMVWKEVESRSWEARAQRSG
ncbi:MAG TPA: hypothetical protein VGA86_10770 [Desulfatiglandales bacterium]